MTTSAVVSIRSITRGTCLITFLTSIPIQVVPINASCTIIHRIVETGCAISMAEVAEGFIGFCPVITELGCLFQVVERSIISSVFIIIIP